MTLKKLVFFIPSIEGGGVEKNLFIITNYFIKKKIKIHLITANKEFRNKFNGKISIISPKKKNIKNFSRYKKYFYCLILLLGFILKNKKTLIFSFQANIYATIIAKLCFQKIIIRSNSSPSGWSKNYLKNLLYKYFFRFCDVIIVNSKEFKKQMLKRFNIKTVCIYNPLDLETIKRKSKEKVLFKFKKNRLKIISIGRFVEQKDHLTLLKSLKILRDKIKFQVILMGQGILKRQYQNYIKENKMMEDIKILNFKKNPYPYIKKSDLFILSSKFEGLPNVLLEAISLKKKIISSNCPTGPKEILLNGKIGLLFKVMDSNNLANKILLIHNKKCKNFENEAYASLKRFEYEKNCKLYFDIVTKLLK
jgi:glycosyltransferase involved in cell wall biosynthesis